MKFDLAARDVEPIVAALAEQKGALQDLLATIAEADPWQPEFEDHLDAVYRTRIRHLFAPRQHADRLAEFARHLNVAASVVRARSADLADRLMCYEAIVNDAVDEVDGGWLEEVLAKKHISDILKVLAAKRGADMRSDQLRVQTGLESANLSRKLGLMETAGLIAKRYEGSELLVQATLLGLNSHVGRNGEGNAIRSVGFSEQGAFVDRVDSMSSCVLDRVSGALFLSPRAFPNVRSPIAKKDIVRFGLYPLDKSGDAFEVYVDVRVAGAETRICLGVWRNRQGYQEVLDWVENANARVQGPVTGGPTLVAYEKVIHRVLDRGVFRYVPGWSMSAAGIARMGEYKREWMHDVANNIVTSVSRINPNAKPVKAKLESWPERYTWDRIYDRILARDVHARTPRRSLDMCFEFLYYDPQRVGRYDIVRLGELRTFTLVYHEENTRFAAVRDLIKKLAEESAEEEEAGTSHAEQFKAVESSLVWPYLHFEKALQQIAVVHNAEIAKQPDPWRIQSMVGTVSDNMLHTMLGQGVLSDDDVVELRDSARCVEMFVKENAARGVVAICDNVIANDLMANWKLQGHVPSRLKTQMISYPSRIPVGIGVPVGDSEWKAIVHAALSEMAQSRDPEVRASWEETLLEAGQIGIRVDPDFVPRDFAPTTLNEEIIA